MASLEELSKLSDIEEAIEHQDYLIQEATRRKERLEARRAAWYREHGLWTASREDRQGVLVLISGVSFDEAQSVMLNSLKKDYPSKSVNVSIAGSALWGYGIGGLMVGTVRAVRE